jgi:hypothetical protein
MPEPATSLLPTARMESRIFIIRGEKVMLDADLAELYGISTKTLNQAVKRNLERFPADFMFQLTEVELSNLLKSKTVTSKIQSEINTLDRNELLRSQIVTSKRPSSTGGRRYLPSAFTEQGVAMLSGVLRSSQAVQVNIEIMRAFVRLRQLIASSADLSRKLRALEKKYDDQFKVVFEAIRELMSPIDADDQAREIGFHTLQKPAPAKTGKS